MLPLRRAVGCALVWLAAGGGLRAQDTKPELRSGPVAGVPLPACPVYAPSGPLAGTEFDATQRLGKGPGVFLFVHELNRNTAPMLSGLDRLAAQLAWTGLETFTVRLAADRTEAEAAVKRSSDALRMYRPILVSTDGAEGPGGFALHRQATLTIVLAKDGVVVRSVAFTDTGRADLPMLRKLVEEVTGPIPSDPEKLRAAMAARLTKDPERLQALVIDLALQLQRAEQANETRAERPGGMQRKPADDAKPGESAPKAPRVGKPPEDDELRALLRRAIQRAADGAELDAVFAAVDQRVGDDAGLRAQVVEMWKLMINLDYGTDDAKGRAKAWLERHGPK